MSDDGIMRSFDTGATRDTGTDKLDYEGFLSPQVLRQFGRFMKMNQLQSNGEIRASDNWQKGIPDDVYMKSGYRHFFEWWENHRTKQYLDREGEIEFVAAMSGLMFNVMGYLHEYLKTHSEIEFDTNEPTVEMQLRQLKVAKEKSRGR